MKFKFLEDLLLKLDEKSQWAGRIQRKNAVSLAAADISPVRRIAQQVQKGLGLTDKQKALALLLLKKYQRQLRKFGVETEGAENLPLRYSMRKVDSRKTLKYFAEDKSYFVLSFNFDKKLIDTFISMVKNSAYGFCDFVKPRGAWFIVNNDHNLFLLGNFAQRFDFEIESSLFDRYFELHEFEKNLKYKKITLLEDFTFAYAPTELVQYMEEKSQGMSEDQKTVFYTDQASTMDYVLSKEFRRKLQYLCQRLGGDYLERFFTEDYIVEPWKDDQSFAKALSIYMDLSGKKKIFLLQGGNSMAYRLSQALFDKFDKVIKLDSISTAALQYGDFNDKKVPQLLKDQISLKEKVLVIMDVGIWPHLLTNFLELNNLISSVIILELAKYRMVQSPSLAQLKYLKKIRILSTENASENNIQR